MTPAVCFRAVVALVGQFPVLAGIDLDVDCGQIVLLQGPNGAGKTSLLRATAGLLKVTAGRAEVLGLDVVADSRAIRRRVGMLGHATGLYDDLTVEDNVRFALRAGGGSVRALPGALDRLGLSGRLRRVSVSRLSAGQRRRVALAALVARSPELWLLDEPHAGLDQDGRDVIDALIRQAVRAGSTVVLASHEADRASALADRVVTVAGGVVVSDYAAPVVTASRREVDGEADKGAAGEANEVGGDGGGSAPLESPVHVA